MVHPVYLPQLGQTMEEGTIEKWRKQEGETVQKGEVLYELTTDKATLEVESFASGVLRRVIAAEGQTVPVNALVAVIAEADEHIPEDLLSGAPEPAEQPPAEAKERPTPTRAPPAATGSEAGARSASPRARRLAEEQKVPLAALSGTGPGGRVIEGDVRRYLEKAAEVRATPAARAAAYRRGVSLVELGRAAPDRRLTAEDVLAATAKPPGDVAGRRVELTPMRRTIARRMTEAKQSIPHFYLTTDVWMDAAMAFLERLRRESAEKITLTAVLVKAAGHALRHHPRVNAQFTGDAVVMKERCNVGVAVAVEDGLFVPVIRDADRKGIGAISAELRSLADAARRGNLLPEQYEGGSITLSNLGMFAVDYFQAIINPPESCIIGVGTARQRPVVREGQLGVARMMGVTLSADHRVLDGVEAARFMESFQELLEAPDRLRG